MSIAPAVSPSRPGLKAHRDSRRLAFPELVNGLRDMLGARLVAYIGHVTNTRTVREWIEGKHDPGDAVIAALRDTYFIAALLCEEESRETVQAWFQGMNPDLDDFAPATLLRNERYGEIGNKVAMAARSFLAHG